MATTVYKVLGQIKPAATTLTTLFTATTETVISVVSVANTSTVSTFRIAVRKNGETLENKHYIAYDASLPAGESVFLTLGITLSATDVVSVYSASGEISFGLFGSEVSA